MRGIALTAVLVIILIAPSKPVADLILAVAILTWSVPPLVRRARLTLTTRLTAVAGLVFAAGLVMRFIDPAGLLAGRLILLVVGILTCSAVWFVLPLAQWRRLTWVKRLAAIGGIAFTAVLGSVLIGASEPVVDLILAVAILIWSVLPLVWRWRRPSWPKRLAAATVTVFVAAGAAIFVIRSFTQSEPVSLENAVGWIFFILIFIAIMSYYVTMLSRATALPATWAIVAFSVIFLYIFPPLLAFLATNGGISFRQLAAQVVNTTSSWPIILLGLLQSLLLVAVPALLIGFPEILRRKLAGTEKSDVIESLLPGELAFAAAIATGLYAVTLHFFKGPLATVSPDQLAFAALAVVVLLGPFYRHLATACWKRGIADVFNPRKWVTEQRELIKLLRKESPAPIESQTPDGPSAA